MLKRRYLLFGLIVLVAARMLVRRLRSDTVVHHAPAAGAVAPRATSVIDQTTQTARAVTTVVRRVVQPVARPRRKPLPKAPPDLSAFGWRGRSTHYLLAVVFISGLVRIAITYLTQSDFIASNQPDFMSYTVRVGFETISMMLFLLLLPAIVRWRLLAPVRYVRQRPVLLWFVLLAFVFIAFIEWEVQRYNPRVRWLTLVAITVAITFVLTIDLRPGEWATIKHKLSMSRRTNMMIALTTVVIMLVVIELGMRHFMVMSDNFGQTLMHQNWLLTYFNPRNELDYRDYPIAQDVPDAITRVLVIGDSFTAGQGINQLDDTFPQLLRAELGERYTVNTMAQPGWATDAQLEALQFYPLDPDVVVLAYYINDIEYASVAFQHQIGLLLNTPPGLLRPVVNSLYLPNFVYWHIVQQVVNHGHQVYGEQLLDVYDDAEAWDIHSEDLQRIITYANDHDAQLIVMFWPNMLDISGSLLPILRVETFFSERDVPVINLVDALRLEESQGLTVSVFDSHPNELAHRIAADNLLPVIQELPQR